MTRRRASLLSVIIAAALTALLYAVVKTLPSPQVPISQPAPQTQVAQPGYYVVTQAIDGDTFQIVMSGKKESVRLIGVDTPETHKPDTPVQCYGPEASDFARQTIEGKQVRLEADPTNDNRDRYDRLLRYAYLPDGTLFNKKLIEEGYGFAYLSFPFTKKSEFAAAQAQARTAGKGLWAACHPYQLNGGRWQTNAYDSP